jgi:hypothetical protein
MANCLRPTGIPSSAYRHDLDSDKAKLASVHSIPHCERDSMPAWPGSLIETARGTRKLMNDEIARGLGAPKSWLGDAYPKAGTVRRTPAVHLLEYLSHFLVTPEPREANPGVTKPLTSEALPQDDHIPFSWKPPDLGPTSAWTKQRVFNLIRASLEYVSPGRLIEKGLQNLRRHRTNYDSEGPKPTHLQLLWWEFPCESWDELREGCLMNFLHPPAAGITPNSEMAPEQRTIAGEFVDELVSLGVLVPVLPGEMV